MSARVGDPSGDYLEPNGQKWRTDIFITKYHELTNVYGSRGELFYNVNNDTGDITFQTFNQTTGANEYAVVKVPFGTTHEEIEALAVETFDHFGTRNEGLDATQD